ncbi:hypothetical protein AAVH_24173, partial [Aphelenchoides avenae]
MNTNPDNAFGAPVTQTKRGKDLKEVNSKYFPGVVYRFRRKKGIQSGEATVGKRCVCVGCDELSKPLHPMAYVEERGYEIIEGPEYYHFCQHVELTTILDEFKRQKADISDPSKRGDASLYVPLQNSKTLVTKKELQKQLKELRRENAHVVVAEDQSLVSENAECQQRIQSLEAQDERLAGQLENELN